MHSAFSLTRISKDSKYTLFYAYRVRGKEDEISTVLPENYKVIDQYGKGKVEVDGNKVTVYPTNAELFATVVLLEKL